MVERTPNRPIPEGELKQNAPEAGAGPLGIPPPTPEHSLQGGGSTSPEHQPLPSVWDVLEGDVRLRTRHGGRLVYPKGGYWEFRRQARELNDLDIELRKKGTDRDRLILKLYGTLTRGSVPSHEVDALSPQAFQRFRSQVEPMSEEEIADELRKVERKHDIYRRMVETRDRNALLTPEERGQKQYEKELESNRRWRQANPEKVRKYARDYRQRRKEREKLKANKPESVEDSLTPPKK